MNNRLKIIKYTILIFSILFLSNGVAAQSIDTLTVAKQLNSKGKFTKAENLLRQYVHENKQNLNAHWLYAQTAYWAHHFRTFNNAYKEATKYFPENYYLKLDYALKLIENGDIKKALPVLETYAQYDSISTIVKMSRAKIEYWQGDFNSAIATLQSKSYEKEKNNESAELMREILVAKSPWLKINFNFLSDDQPLKSYMQSIEAGIFVNTLFAPNITLNIPTFDNGVTTKYGGALSIGNKFNLIKPHIAANINAGYMILPDKKSTWTGTIEVTKTSFKYLEFQLRLSHQPYLTTLASISNSVVPYQYSISAGWNNPKSWYGKISSSVLNFTNDKNYISVLNGWMFAPPIKIAVIKLRIGYAYGYSSSRENRFISKVPLSEIISNYTDGNITGIYDPYFTPTSQKAHSAVLNVEGNVHSVVMGANANIGFLSTTKNPYLFLDTDNTGAIFINHDFSSIKYYPQEISAFALYRLTNKISIKGEYAYLKNNFYQSHGFGLSLKINFLNEKDKK